MEDDKYRNGLDLMSIHARVNNETVFVSNIDNRPGTHMGLIQNAIALALFNAYKDLEELKVKHGLSEEVERDLKRMIKDLEPLAGKIAVAVQVNLRSKKS